LRRDGLKYRSQPLLTGPESRVAEVSNVAFPKLLDPIDDFPPATVITHIAPSPTDWGGGDGGLLVRGTSSDNGTITKVVVNGVNAKATRANFAVWEVTLSNVKVGTEIRAHAVDEAGNAEVTPHVVVYSDLLIRR